MLTRYPRYLATGLRGLVRDYPWTCVWALGMTALAYFGGDTGWTIVFTILFGLLFVYLPIRLFEASVGQRLMLQVNLGRKPSVTSYLEDTDAR